MMHPGLVTEDAASCQVTCRIDGKHCKFLFSAYEEFAKRFDKTTLADSRRHSNPNTRRIPGMRDNSIENLASALGIFRECAFDQCDGLCQDKAIASKDALCIFLQSKARSIQARNIIITVKF